MAIKLFHGLLVLNLVLLCASGSFPLYTGAGQGSMIEVKGGISGVYLYRSDQKIDTLEGKPVIKYHDGIVFDMIKGEEFEYAYYLDGPDEGWSYWTPRSYKEYTNLGPGRYTFQYRYRVNGGKISGEGSFRFRVRAPWYFSPVAWVIYPLLFFFIVMMLRRRTHRLFMEREKRLEELIAERTEELQHEKEKSDNLLANMLPKGTAQESCQRGRLQKRNTIL